MIVRIRQSKLPDPVELGNSGSFFKNAIVSSDTYIELQKSYPDLKAFKASDRAYKIPSAWLIEQCGWKGKRIGDAGVYKNHALVLVNHGNATGQEIYKLSTEIQASVCKSLEFN